MRRCNVEYRSVVERYQACRIKYDWRPIKCDEINFSDKWILNDVVSQRLVSEDITNSDYSHITQNPDGKVYIEFTDNSPVYSSPIYNRRTFSGYRR